MTTSGPEESPAPLHPGDAHDDMDVADEERRPEDADADEGRRDDTRESAGADEPPAEPVPR